MSYRDDFSSTNPNDAGFDNADFDSGGHGDAYDPSREISQTGFQRERAAHDDRDDERDDDDEPRRAPREQDRPIGQSGFQPQRRDGSGERYAQTGFQPSAGVYDRGEGRPGDRYDNSHEGYEGPGPAGRQDGRPATGPQHGYQEPGTYGSGNTGVGHYSGGNPGGPPESYGEASGPQGHGSQGHGPPGKVGFGDKLKGNLEVLAGKVTHNTAMVEHGEDRKQYGDTKTGHH